MTHTMTQQQTNLSLWLLLAFLLFQIGTTTWVIHRGTQRLQSTAHLITIRTPDTLILQGSGTAHILVHTTSDSLPDIPLSQVITTSSHTILIQESVQAQIHTVSPLPYLSIQTIHMSKTKLLCQSKKIQRLHIRVHDMASLSIHCTADTLIVYADNTSSLYLAGNYHYAYIHAQDMAHVQASPNLPLSIQTKQIVGDDLAYVQL